MEDDRIAGVERRTRVRFVDDARAVQAEDDRQPVRYPRAAVAHIEVDAIETARNHADAQFSGRPLRDRQIVKVHDVIAAMSVNARHEHRHRVSLRSIAQKPATASSVACGWSTCGEWRQASSTTLVTGAGDLFSIARICSSVPYWSSAPWIKSAGTRQRPTKSSMFQALNPGSSQAPFQPQKALSTSA
jgi:hypothetical protein